LLSGIKEFTITNEESGNIYLPDFMMDVALLTDADNTKDDDKNYVTLMTIHSSKGLEFPHVFLVGMEENLFPSQMVLNSRTELEEERRLFYVAVTRAKNTCTLTYAASRFVWGNLQTSESSRFITEIDDIYLEMENPPRAGGRSLSSGFDKPFTGGLNRSLSGSSSTPAAPKNFKPVSRPSGTSIAGSENLELKVGYMVNHDRFGKGKVTQMVGDGQDKKATIFFPHHGAKTVLLRFANLTVFED
jgi:DNA helicase II / ATP-dependent DNA helicase PcrA